MSVTILNEVEKAQALTEGLRKHLAEAAQMGITPQAVERVEAAYKDLKGRDDEVEALRRQLTVKVRENNKLTAELKAEMMALRRVVKSHHAQAEWLRFGVQDKR